MPHAMLFYRTLTTKKVTIPDPNDLPAGQKLLFTPPEDLAKLLDDELRLNIVRTPPALTGGRRINQSDQGVISWLVTIEGDYDTGSTEAPKIYDFTKIPQYDTFHKFGCIGLSYPEGPSELVLIDPTDTIGFMIEAKRGRHIGITKNLVDFGVRLSFGGDLP